MYKRDVLERVKDGLSKYRCVTLVGPRQSGKTTLSREVGDKSFEYFNFEYPETRERFLADPKAFLSQIKNSCIFDEVQKVPDLFSYLQIILDTRSDNRKFILTGSNNLQLSETVSQSLAGRTRIFQILPFSYSEIIQKVELEKTDFLFQGGYPRIYDQQLPAREWLADYYKTYIEKDVRQLLNVGNLDQFSRFVRLCAGRVGQLLSASSLGNDAGITAPTVESWISVLKASYTCFTLQPHFKNFNKRIIKAPKLYFYDTGLLCYLLQIQSPEQLAIHPLVGSIFENAMIVEAMKTYFNRGEDAPIYFWRDQHGHEIDLIFDQGIALEPVEIKYGETFSTDFLKNLQWFRKLQSGVSGKVIYGGDDSFSVDKIDVLPWNKPFVKP